MAELDSLIHAPKRLRIMSLLDATDGIEFAFLQDRTGLTAPDLSKQMAALAEAGLVTIRKTGRGPGSSTWYRMTRQGRSAYQEHVEALLELIDRRSAETS